MFENYRVVVVCPAGRRHLADILRRHVEQARPIVDEMHWWLNTDNLEDLSFFSRLTAAAPDFYRAIAMPGAFRFNRRHMSIARFFRHAIDPKTIYVRVDDDIVWMDKDCIKNLLIHRVTYPDAYLVYANIVNSSRFMHLHQKGGAFDPGYEISYEINHATNRKSVVSGLAAHRAILDTVEALAAGGDRETLLKPWTSFGRWIFAPGEYNDVSMLAWFGIDFANWNGICPASIHEEQWICLRMPCKFGGRIHEACGDALCVHYASVIQWPGVSSFPDIVARYQQLAPHSDIEPTADIQLMDNEVL